MSRSLCKVAPISFPDVTPILLRSWPLTGKRGMDHLQSSASSFLSPWYFSSSHTLSCVSSSRFWKQTVVCDKKKSTEYSQLKRIIYLRFHQDCAGVVWSDLIDLKLATTKVNNLTTLIVCWLKKSTLSDFAAGTGPLEITKSGTENKNKTKKCVLCVFVQCFVRPHQRW